MVLPHVPVSKQTLDESVTALIESNANPLPDVTEGYKQWKKAKGGVFTITVAEIIQLAEDAISGKEPSVKE